jgi:arginine exporter protein ArgO
MTDVVLAGLLAGYGVAVPVGAIAVLIISLTARTSLRVGASAALGVAAADGVYAVVAVLGGAALAGLIAPISGPLRWVAAAVLIGIAIRTAWYAFRHYRDPARAATLRGGLGTPGRAFVGVLGLTLLNPATIVYFAALVLGSQADDSLSGWAAVVFVLAAFVASASWQLTLALGGSLVGRWVSGPRGRLVTALVSSGIIVILAGVMVTGG